MVVTTVQGSSAYVSELPMRQFPATVLRYQIKAQGERDTAQHDLPSMQHLCGFCIHLDTMGPLNNEAVVPSSSVYHGEIVTAQ